MSVQSQYKVMVLKKARMFKGTFLALLPLFISCGELKPLYQGASKKCKTNCSNQVSGGDAPAQLTQPDDLPLDFDFWNTATLRLARPLDSKALLEHLEQSPINLFRQSILAMESDLSAAKNLAQNSHLGAREKCVIDQMGQSVTFEQGELFFGLSTKNYGGCLDYTKIRPLRTGLNTKTFSTGFRVFRSSFPQSMPRSLPKLPWDWLGIWPFVSESQAAQSEVGPNETPESIKFMKVTYTAWEDARSGRPAPSAPPLRVTSWSAVGSGTPQSSALSITLKNNGTAAAHPWIEWTGSLFSLEGMQESGAGQNESSGAAVYGIYEFVDFGYRSVDENIQPQSVLKYALNQGQNIEFKGRFLLNINGNLFEYSATDKPCLMLLSHLKKEGTESGWSRENLGQISLCQSPTGR